VLDLVACSCALGEQAEQALDEREEDAVLKESPLKLKKVCSLTNDDSFGH